MQLSITEIVSAVAAISATEDAGKAGRAKQKHLPTRPRQPEHAGLPCGPNQIRRFLWTIRRGLNLLNFGWRGTRRLVNSYF